jgi:hypothetical protein
MSDDWTVGRPVVNPVIPIRVKCVCTDAACPRIGTPRPRPWSNGELHIKRCRCPERCGAGAQTGLARRRESKVARAVGGTRNAGSGNKGGGDVINGLVDVEETAQADITRSFRRWWLGAAVQKKVAQLLRRQFKPRALVLSWDNKPQFVVMPFGDFAHLCEQGNWEMKA